MIDTMINTIYNIFGAFFFSYYFVNIARIPSAIKKGFGMMPHQRMKPFDCATCLSVWVASALFFAPVIMSQFLFIVFGAGYIGYKAK